MQSVWTDRVVLPQYDSLRGNHKTDVLIIGGGITGILCAYFLNKLSINYMLVEAEEICSGITKDTTAKITSQHGLIYDSLVRNIGRERAGLYLQANEDAIGEYRKLAKGLACEFTTLPSYVYSLKDPDKILREVKTLENMGFKAKYVKNTELPFQVEAAVSFPNQAQFHPLQFLRGIAEGLTIYEHTRVLEIKKKDIVTSQGRIRADKVIVATHYPFLNKHGSYFLKLYQQRSYVLALQNAQKLQGMYVDEAEGGLSFRCDRDLLLLGGGSHRTGKCHLKWKELEKFAEKNYINSVVKYAWATQDCMSLDRIPYIGPYGKGAKDYYVASGYNKWGMSSSMVAAKLLCDYILEKENPYMQVFHPRRSILKPQLFSNIAESTKGLLTIDSKRCPHMGCGLKWNPQERSFDCSCHGSRFTQDGKLIDNPANGDAKINSKTSV